jgi:lipopolysaccharide/colanic/teichoic acid biosynthesis glycosyltransferase
LRPVVKRVADIIGSFLALVILSPIYGLFALAVKLDSLGPVFFKQKRHGLNGKKFTFYKFRSMFQTKTEDKEREEEFKNYINNKEDKKCLRANNK